MATNLKFYKKSSAPSATTGSIWFDTSEGSLKLNNGNWQTFGITKEAFLQWGGKNFAGSFGPIDAALIPELGANRFAFLKEGISIEYSRDGGSTWNAYTLNTDYFKIFGPFYKSEYYVGNRSESNIDKSKDQLRVTITTNTAGVYTELKKFAIYCSTRGSSYCWCTITARTKADVDSGTENWRTFADKVEIRGWGGWNIINTPTFTTYFNNSTQYQYIRFTFGCDDSPATNNYSGLSINSIMAFGGSGWGTPSNMASNGHLYSYDSYQNAIFPATVTASGIKKVGSNDTYVLLGGGGHAQVSNLSVASAKTATSATSAAGLTWAEYKD